MLLSVFALVIALSGPFMTLLVAGFDRKKILLLAILMFLVSGLVSSLSPPFWLLMLVRVIPAFLQPVYIATALSVAVTKGEEKHKNELMSIVFSGIAIAMVSTVPFATWVASKLSWEYSFIIQSLVSVIALIAIYFFLPSLPVVSKKSYGDQVKILTQPTFIASTAMNFFMIAAWFSLYSYFAEYLNKAKGLGNTDVSYMLFVFGVIGVIANRISGKMLNKHVTNTTAFFLSGTIVVPLLISSAPHSLEFANSLATSFGNLGVTLGTTVGGWVIATKGVEFLPWLTLTFGVLAFSMILIRVYLENKTKNRKLQA
jgi:predicted MFS family arabinose efflux permease